MEHQPERAHVLARSKHLRLSEEVAAIEDQITVHMAPSITSAEIADQLLKLDQNENASVVKEVSKQQHCSRPKKERKERRVERVERRGVVAVSNDGHDKVVSQHRPNPYLEFFSPKIEKKEPAAEKEKQKEGTEDEAAAFVTNSKAIDRIKNQSQTHSPIQSTSPYQRNAFEGEEAEEWFEALETDLESQAKESAITDGIITGNDMSVLPSSILVHNHWSPRLNCSVRRELDRLGVELEDPGLAQQVRLAAAKVWSEFGEEARTGWPLLD